MTNTLEKRHKVNKDLNTVRAIETVIKVAKPSKLKLGEETIAHIPTDMEVMIISRLMISNMEQEVRMANILSGISKSHGIVNIPIDVQEKLTAYKELFKKDYDRQKKITSKIIDMHPLSNKLSKIRGFTSYQLGIIMSYIGDPRKFASPSNLFVYAGVAPKNGLVVTLANLHMHRMMKHEANVDPETKKVPEDFTEFGFHVQLKSRMFLVVESLLKQKGFFYNEFQKARVHLHARAINNNECFIATEQDKKDSNGVMKIGEYYMKNKKNQSLSMWTYRNASWRQARTLLHIIYCEWLELLGQKARSLYAIEYLGHQRLITIDEVLTYEAGLKAPAPELDTDLI